MREAAKEREAGRQLDAEIAERVMGFAPVAAHWKSKLMHVPDDYMPGAGAVYLSRKRCMPVPAFSSDIAAAFQAVEAMRAKGFAFMANTYDGMPWLALFTWVEWTNSAGVAHGERRGADTLPLAICLASLKALDASRPAEAQSTHSTDVPTDDLGKAE